MKRIFYAGGSPWLQVLVFICAVLGGVVLWLGILSFFSPQSWRAVTQGETVPALWKNLYLTGLYLWIWLLLLSVRRFRKESWADWGLSSWIWPSLVWGGLYGVLLLLCVRGLSLLQGVDFLPLLQPSVVDWFQYLLISLVIACCLALIEEVLFRGFFLQLWLCYGPLRAVLLQALCFSLVHGESWQHAGVAVNLGLMGCVLGCLRLSCRHLGWSLGLHTGWVFALGVLVRLQGLHTLQGTWSPLRHPALSLFLGGLLIWLWQRFEQPINDAGSVSVS